MFQEGRDWEKEMERFPLNEVKRGVSVCGNDKLTDIFYRLQLIIVWETEMQIWKYAASLFRSGACKGEGVVWTDAWIRYKKNDRDAAECQAVNFLGFAFFQPNFTFLIPLKKTGGSRLKAKHQWRGDSLVVWSGSFLWRQLTGAKGHLTLLWFWDVFFSGAFRMWIQEKRKGGVASKLCFVFQWHLLYSFMVLAPARAHCRSKKLRLVPDHDKRKGTGLMGGIVYQTGTIQKTTQSWVVVKKNGHSSVKNSIWSRWWESNSRSQLGRLKFYHWTTPA